ncbi:hypothetical protein BDU57DRAFT_185666 [Ampelomyces quisqualis]|uniref:Serine-rich protein n=1 Tax=Ampelomyces quisqualis TaxID=50730 RepID=A0A6A5QQQ4_AMPQU|nr:hypothetical protein BDU57DRAFT_185666 [Ampelomyces quisqualis]
MSSDYTTHRRNSSRQRSIESPLDQAPKLSPPTSTSRSASPVRKPLHDRSNSQSNQFSGPTIRIVEDPGSDIYSKYPIPSQASQVLPPPRHAPGYGFERPASRVSSGSQVANTIAKFEAGKTRVIQPPAPLQIARKKKLRHSVSTSASDADTLVASSYTPSSLRFSQGSTPPTSPPPEFVEFEKGLEVLREEPVHPLHRSTIRAVPPSSSGGESSESRAHALKSQESVASLASTTAAAPISQAGNSTSISQPIPKGHKHTPSSGSRRRQSVYANDADNQHRVLRPKTSEASFAFSDISYTSIEPTHHNIPSSQPSPTLHEARTATFASGVPVTYSLVRAPSATSSRAVSENLHSFASRMQDRTLVHQWSSQLSTIPSVSEERDSRSLARASRSNTRSQSQESYNGNGNSNGRTNYPRQRGYTIGSARSSTDNVSEGQTEFSAVPLPLFSPASPPSMEEKDHNGEHLDTISPLPASVPLRMKKSGYLRRRDSNSESGSNTESRPGSAQSDTSSFFHSTIPAWARVYYRRGERVSMGASGTDSTGSLRPDTAHSVEGNFPTSIYRPRNRPRNRASQAETMSMTEDIQPIDGVNVPGSNMPPLSGWSTPHLRTDRRSGMHYSVWKAPSFDADLHTTLLGRQNRQVLCFCIGFIFPLAWMIASFLPLPLDPSRVEAGFQTDLEQQFARNMAAIDDKAFQKATWWRNLNRIMSGIGTLLIGVIIALAVLISKM